MVVTNTVILIYLLRPRASDNLPKNILNAKDINAAMLAAMSVNSTKFHSDRYSKSGQELESRNNAGKRNINPNDLKKPGVKASEYWWLF